MAVPIQEHGVHNAKLNYTVKTNSKFPANTGFVSNKHLVTALQDLRTADSIQSAEAKCVGKYRKRKDFPRSTGDKGGRMTTLSGAEWPPAGAARRFCAENGKN